MTLTVALPRTMTMRSTDADWTAADWERLPDNGNRYEIIGGVLYMSTAPSLFHQWIVARLIALFEAQLVTLGIAYAFPAPVGVFMADSTPVQPDVVVVLQDDRDILHDRRVFGTPELLVEILSPSNAEVDLETKREAYARAGVPEYWIVRPVEREVWVYSTPETATGHYRVFTRVSSNGELLSPTLPIRTAITAFFAGAPDTAL